MKASELIATLEDGGEIIHRIEGLVTGLEDMSSRQLSMVAFRPAEWEEHTEPHDWAWACEQMLKGEKVHRNAWESRAFVYLRTANQKMWKETEEHVTGFYYAPFASDLTATDWRLWRR